MTPERKFQRLGEQIYSILKLEPGKDEFTIAKDRLSESVLISKVSKESEKHHVV